MRSQDELENTYKSGLMLSHSTGLCAVYALGRKDAEADVPASAIVTVIADAVTQQVPVIAEDVVIDSQALEAANAASELSKAVEQIDSTQVPIQP